MAELSRGARVLLGHLTQRGWKLGYSWYRQESLAKELKSTLRTVNRWVMELKRAGKLTTERHGHGNYYFVKELQEKMAYRAESVENPVEMRAKPVDSGVSDTPFLAHRDTSPPISEIRSEIKQQQSARLRQSDDGSLAQKRNPDTPSSDPLEPSGSLSVTRKLQRKPMEFARDIERLAQTMRLGGGP